jgi:hypothetical protein
MLMTIRDCVLGNIEKEDEILEEFLLILSECLEDVYGE